MSKASEYASRVEAAKLKPQCFARRRTVVDGRGESHFIANVTPEGNLQTSAAELIWHDVPEFVAWLKETFQE